MNGNVQINMELQVIMFTYWAERALFYLSKMYMKQIRKGQDYDVLQKCIHVGILDFELFGSGEYYSRFHMWEDLRKELYSDKLEIQAIRDHNNIISSGWVRGCERGRKEGMRLGLQEGLKQGARALIEFCQEMELSKEDTFFKLCRNFLFRRRQKNIQKNTGWIHKKKAVLEHWYD